MSKSERSLDRQVRSQRQRTRHRQDRRLRRRTKLAIVAAIMVAVVLVAMPALVIQSGLAARMLTRSLAEMGVDAQWDSLRIGWTTPLSLTGLRMEGRQAGTRVQIAQLDVPLTAIDLLRGDYLDLQTVDIRGVHVVAEIRPGESSLEADLRPLLEMPAGDGDSLIGTIRVQDMVIDAVDRPSGRSWTLDQSHADVVLSGEATRIRLSGVLRDPNDAEGSLDVHLTLPNQSPDPAELWSGGLAGQTLPLSLVALAERRFPELSDTMPRDVAGDMSGECLAAGRDGGMIDLAFHGVEVRNFSATLEAKSPAEVPKLWHNELATIDGGLLLTADRIVGNQLRLASDFATARFDGSLPTTWTTQTEGSDPLRWLTRIDGWAEADVDLARMHQTLPNLLPTRSDVKIVDGRLSARLESPRRAETVRRRLTLQTDPIRARTALGPATIRPIQFNVLISETGKHLSAETFQLRSEFANADGRGDLRSGSTDIRCDFDQLTRTLEPILQVSSQNMQGVIDGRVSWQVNAQDRWELTGSGQATDFAITLPDGTTIDRDSVLTDVQAIGMWRDGSLQELSQAAVRFSSDGMVCQAELTNPVERPNLASAYRMRLEGEGPLATLSEIFGPWLPEPLRDTRGNFQWLGNAKLSRRQIELDRLDINLRNPSLVHRDRLYHERAIDLRMAGRLEFESADAFIEQMTWRSDALSATAMGSRVAGATNLEVQFQANLDKLNGSMTRQVAQGRPITKASHDEMPPARDGYDAAKRRRFSGDVKGSIRVAGSDNRWRVVTEAAGTDLAMFETDLGDAPGSTPAVRNAVGQRPVVSAVAQDRQRPLWSETEVRLDAEVVWDGESGELLAEQANLTTPWLTTDLSGKASLEKGTSELRLRGPVSVDMQKVAAILTTLSGSQVQAVGWSETPIEIHAHQAPNRELAFEVIGELGWDAASAAGFELGSARVPVRLTQSEVVVDPSRVPVGQGFVVLGGNVRYQPGSVTLSLLPGTLAEDVQVTPEMADRWLKYLAPVVADAARIDGTLGVVLDEGYIDIDAPSRSRVAGQLEIRQMQLLSGPVTTQIISSVDQLRGLSDLANGRDVAPLRRDRRDTELITLMPQRVDFLVDRGQVFHQRLVMQIDRVEVFTGGAVGMDGQLDVVAQVPLDDRWLGRDLQALAGQTMKFPIVGTLWRPQLDRSEMQRAVATVGTRAVENAVDGYLDRGRQKINEELNRGFEKLNESLNLGPLFGR